MFTKVKTLEEAIAAAPKGWVLRTWDEQEGRVRYIPREGYRGSWVPGYEGAYATDGNHASIVFDPRAMQWRTWATAPHAMGATDAELLDLAERFGTYRPEHVPSSWLAL